jgi:hypothetical protein
MTPRVYVEPSVISDLVARRNQRDLLVAPNQKLTHKWWDTRRHKFDLYASAVVLAEAARGEVSGPGDSANVRIPVESLVE